MTERAIAKEILDAAFRMHTTLGPGLLESIPVLVYEPGRRGLHTLGQQPSTASKTITQSPQAAKRRGYFAILSLGFQGHPWLCSSRSKYENSSLRILNLPTGDAPLVARRLRDRDAN